MADFCFQCNCDMFFGPCSDFAHLGKDGEQGRVWLVICEGCNVPGTFYTMVNGKGWCIDPDCQVHGRDVPPERREAYERARRWVERRSGRLGWWLRLWDHLWGTPWEPGLRHDWRYRYHVWRYGDPISEMGLEVHRIEHAVFNDPLDLGQYPTLVEFRPDPEEPPRAD